MRKKPSRKLRKWLKRLLPIKKLRRRIRGNRLRLRRWRPKKVR